MIDWLLAFVKDHIIGGGPTAWALTAAWVLIAAWQSKGKWAPLWQTLWDEIILTDWVIVKPLWAFIVAVARSTADGEYSTDEMAKDRGGFVGWVDRLLSVLQQLYSIAVPAQIMVMASKRVLSKVPKKT